MAKGRGGFKRPKEELDSVITSLLPAEMTKAAFRAREVWTCRHRGASRATKLNIGGTPIGRFTRPSFGVAQTYTRELLSSVSGRSPASLVVVSENPQRYWQKKRPLAGAKTEERTRRQP